MVKQDDIIIDCFAGGGGASVGIEMALGRSVDIAINHDPDAILMHKTNHPNTLHLTEDIFRVDLQKYVRGRHVALMWASPDCTSHSKAKGGKPRNSGLRILPWAVYKHAKAILPDVIIMENVEEIQQWGPLDNDGYPIKERKGEEYENFIEKMKSLGYEFDSRELVAADYGAPTTRKRWYAIFRRDGKSIVWPEQTHNKSGTNGMKKWVPVYTVLNLSDIGKSIFGRKKPLAENTMRRIARGMQKFVFECNEPFIVQVNHSGEFRGQSLKKPLPTITQKHGFGIVNPCIVPIDKHIKISDEMRCTTGNSNRHCEIISFLTKFYKSGTGQSLFEPIHTITTSPGHFGQINILAVPKEKLFSDINIPIKDQNITTDVLQRCTWVSQFIIEYYGSGTGYSLNEPMHTIVTKDRFALITVLGDEYVILDIFLRMLTAEELKLGQGFPKDYIIDRDYKWHVYPTNKRVERIGNSVVPIMAQKLVESNCGYLKVGERIPCINISDESNGQMRMIV